MTPEELENNPQFEIALKLAHSSITPFIIEQLKNKHWMTRVLFLISFIFFLLFIHYIIQNIALDLVNWGTMLLYTLIGIVFSFTLIIPIHEFIHGIAYWLTGARKINVGAKLRQFIFYVSADQFVIDHKKFTFVALLPFIIITSGYIYLLFNLPTPWHFAISISLFLHTLNCIGDITLLAFIHDQDKPVYTFDDIKQETSYFYRSIKN